MIISHTISNLELNSIWFALVIISLAMESSSDIPNTIDNVKKLRGLEKKTAASKRKTEMLTSKEADKVLTKVGREDARKEEEGGRHLVESCREAQE